MYKVLEIMQKLNTETFISRSGKRHNWFYSYGKTHYISGNTKVTITCPIHGDFEQMPHNHLHGAGCSECKRVKISLARKKDSEWFVRKATELHKGRYSYDNTSYVSSLDKVTITCPAHGDFEQRPSVHLMGCGCPLCKSEKIKASKLRNREEFIELASNKHNHKYDYSQVRYTDSQEKVIITCPVHGDFEQSPRGHLQKRGCRRCMIDRRKITTPQFITRAKAIHGERYKYDKTVLGDTRLKVTITCPVHGDFEQTPNSHMCGNGCRKCKASKGELSVEKILKDNDISYVAEYRLPEVSKVFFFDFYLPEYKLLIEFHGEQHYRPVSIFGGEEGFRSLIRRDCEKKELAKYWGYGYLCLKYTLLRDLKPEIFEKRLVAAIKRHKYTPTGTTS